MHLLGELRLCINSILANIIQHVMDWYSSVCAWSLGLDFKLPVINSSRSIICLPSLKKNICFIEKFSLWSDVLGVVMLLLNYCMERRSLLLSDLDSWLWCSIPLQVGAIFNANYLLTAREIHQRVLVNPPNFDASASDSVKTKSSFSNRSGQFWFQSRTRRTS